MPKTGFDILQSTELTTHERAIVTGASAVFMKDLCRDMYALQSIVEPEQAPAVARACACRALKSEKCAQLEQIVSQVLDSEDGMPEIQNKALLSEILAVYGGSVEAQQEGKWSEHLNESIVPTIVDQAYVESQFDTQNPDDFISEMQKHVDEWDAFEPCTAFQQLVYDAINDICI